MDVFDSFLKQKYTIVPNFFIHYQIAPSIKKSILYFLNSKILTLKKIN
jgi:hypothetical protein